MGSYSKQYTVQSNSIFDVYSSPGISHGYTGHEMVNDMDVIHMNGRTYNPVLGRFMQADPFIQAPGNSQSYNRYAYVLNNPMSYTDPSGYFFNKLFKELNKALGKFAPFVGIAMMFIPGAQGFGATLLKGFIAGGIATGSLKGALVGAFSAGIFYGIGEAFSQVNCSSCYTTSAAGDLTNALKTGARIAKVAAHATAGGVMSVLNSGKFGHGFAAAGLTQAMAGSIDQIGPEINGVRHSDWYSTANRIKRIVAAAVVGGTAAKVTGGKFANGAITGAFSRGFNDEAHSKQSSKAWYKKFTGQFELSVTLAVGDFGFQFAGGLSFDSTGGYLHGSFTPFEKGTGYFASVEAGFTPGFDEDGFLLPNQGSGTVRSTLHKTAGALVVGGSSEISIASDGFSLSGGKIDVGLGYMDMSGKGYTGFLRLF